MSREALVWTEADYVVVGTGAAGSVVAGRLAERGHRVVVLEAGPMDRDKFVHIPAGFAQLFDGDLDWAYWTDPQPALGNRRIFWPRGRVVGGSTSMNAMMWVRGFAADYDEWADFAGPDWSFDSLVPYFRRIERLEGAAAGDEGADGALHISHQRSPRASTAAWLDAAVECGYEVERPNLPEPKGFAQTVVTQRRGARWSVADGYLKPALKTGNLNLITEAVATRVVFDGRRAVGIEFLQGGQRRTVRACREVILCGGAVNTPQLLMLSGIGDARQLRSLGIDVLHNAPTVGAHLLDHFGSGIGFDAEGDTLFGAERPAVLLDYLLRRRGMLTSNAAEAYGFVRSRPDLALPDLELLYAPAPFFDEGLVKPERHGVALVAVLLKPMSNGTVRLVSADPLAKPAVDPRYLSDEDGLDRAALLAGLRTAARIAEAPSMARLLGPIARPRGAVGLGDDTLEAAIELHAQTLYHPTSTCRMGADEASVVDPELRVRGVENLRVADSSVMPTIVRGHTEAPCVIIGERAADLVMAQGR